MAPKHNIRAAHPTINNDLIDRIIVGALKTKPNVKELKEHSVVFEDGSEEASTCMHSCLQCDQGREYLTPHIRLGGSGHYCVRHWLQCRLQVPGP